jgi:hypothetical protein
LAPILRNILLQGVWLGQCSEFSDFFRKK